MAGHDNIWESCSRCTERNQALVVAALRHPAAERINFTYGRLRMTRLWLNRRLHIMTGGMGRVADRVEDGRIPIRPGSPLAAGTYNSVTDEMSFYRAPRLEVAFHEAIHALQDEAQFPNEFVEAEAVAWVGEFAYALARSRMDGFRIRTHGPLEEASLRTAQRLRIHEQSHVYIRRADLAAVEQVIHESQFYPSRGEPSVFNGWHR